MIELRRRYSGSKGSDSPSFTRLPKGYQEVEYLESDGNQYIDLGFRPSVFLKHETEVKYQYLTLFRTSYILASYWETNRGKTTYGVSIRWDSDYIISRIWVEGGQSVFKQIPADTQVHTSKLGFDGSQYYSGIDGELSYNQISDISVLSGNLLAFKAGLETPAIGRIFGIKYSENSEVIHEFIPCKNPQGIAGMYDVAGVYENVHDGFYPNAGTGEFLVGPDVHYNIPPEYQQVEYLKSNGNAYLKLDFEPDIFNEHYLRIKFRLNSTDVQQFLIASYGYSSSLTYAIQSKWNESKIMARIWSEINTNSRVVTEIPIDIDIHTAELGLANRKYYAKIDDTYNDGIFTPVALDKLFVFKAEREPKITKGEVYEIIHAENNIERHHLYPCYRKADNVAGMYDIVNGVFYTNAGTGEFIVGAEVIG